MIEKDQTLYQKDWLSHGLVTLQFVSIAIGVFPYSSPQGSFWWLTASSLGVFIGLYTLRHNRLGNFAVYPEPLLHSELITSGPYRWIRHPMYLSLLLFMLGIAMYNGGLFNHLSLLTLCIAIFGKMHKEESYLRSHFDGYDNYRLKNKRLIPFIY